MANENKTNEKREFVEPKLSKHDSLTKATLYEGLGVVSGGGSKL